MSSTQKDDKTALAAAIAEAHRTGDDTLDIDPRKKADRENQGWLSGDQFTIAETPVAHINATPGTKE
ncbi:unnamed protein product [Rotaria sp. Silwood2]|nr:unnamed protein product [Rotaria sp. Silwood2]CAF2839003.1 unnamed protein product [Rotaria sp. Silwood2]CAF3092947.1 unnamed protein product [Rotaria sp. Silwood2]CAF3246225.1 unnamed protein product [Rotaria sp. Silwood2]CAF3906600.1 unnamed protein product [Rotaria sp. Silwood2]